MGVMGQMISDENALGLVFFFAAIFALMLMAALVADCVRAQRELRKGFEEIEESIRKSNAELKAMAEDFAKKWREL